MNDIDILYNPKSSGLTGEALTVALLRAMEKEPYSALEKASEYIGYIPENRRAELLLRAMEKEPYSALANTPQYIEHIPENRRAEPLLRAMEKEPSSALANASQYIKYIPETRRAESLLRAMEKDPHRALIYASQYIEYIPETRRAERLLAAMEKEPYSALENASQYIKYIPENRRAESLLAAMEKDPYGALASASQYIKHIPKNRRAEPLLRAMEKEPSSALVCASEYIGHIPENRRAEPLLRAMEKEPSSALANASKYIRDIPENRRAEPLLAAMEKSPYSALIYAPEYIRDIPENRRTEPLFAAIEKEPWRALVYVSQYIGYIPENRRAEPLLRAMEKSPYSALSNASRYIEYIPENQRAERLENAAQKLIANLQFAESGVANQYLSDETQSLLLGIRSIAESSLETGQTLNYLHDRPDAQRFDSIKNFSAAQMYELITFGQAELYTSSYIGVFNRFTERLKQEGHQNIFDVADPKYTNSPIIFLESATAYGKLDQAIGLIPKEKWPHVLDLFASKIENSSAQAAASLAEIMQHMPDPAVKAQMEAFLQKHCNDAPEGPVKDIYGVAATYYNQISGRDIITLPNPERYRFDPLKTLAHEQLFGTDGVHRQLMRFNESGDGVGLADFEGFERMYRNNPAYTFEDKGKYVKITSRDSKNKIEIYANRPAESPDEILKAITGRKDAKPDEIEFDAVIHRGHSFDLNDTMPYFSKNVRFAWLGSCGGFGNIEKVLAIAPDAQIASTKQLGTRYVNEPMLYHINESIRKNGGVAWEGEQKYLDGLGNDAKEAYVLPHRNVALAITRKLNGLKADSPSQQSVESIAGSKGDDNFVFVNGAGRTDHLGDFIIPNFETSLVWWQPEDRITVGSDVKGARVYVDKTNVSLFFEDEKNNIIPGTSVTLENFGNGVVTSRLDDLDIWPEGADQPLPSGKIKRIEEPPTPATGVQPFVTFPAELALQAPSPLDQSSSANIRAPQGRVR